VRKADNFAAICEPGGPQHYNTIGLHGLLRGQLYFLLYTTGLFASSPPDTFQGFMLFATVIANAADIYFHYIIVSTDGAQVADRA
jgi:hypothetical protein